MADKEEELPGANSGNNDNGKPPDSPAATATEDTPQNPETGTPEANVEIPQAPAKEKKIEVLLKATGDAPIMMKKKWLVGQQQTVGWISEFIKKCIKMGAEERLFLYINQTFAPAPDQTVKNLYDCYGSDGKLIIHYCKSQAWG